MKVYQRVAKAH